MSCVATASSSITESSARIVFPCSTPVWATTDRTASKIRSGRPEAASRRRQYVSVVGWNPSWSSGSPQATFHRISQRTAATASRSDRSPSACSTRTDAATSPGRLGRPDTAGNKSANNSGGNTSPRCRARKANTLPSGTRCPTSAAASSNCRSARSLPCMRRSSHASRTPGRQHTALFSRVLGQIGSTVRRAFVSLVRRRLSQWSRAPSAQERGSAAGRAQRYSPRMQQSADGLGWLPA